MRTLEQEVERAKATGTTAKPFSWHLVDGASTWTDNAQEIAGMSDQPIIEGLIREGEVVSIVGGAKSCKTWFSLALALAVATGEEFCGMPTHRRKVLYLDYELKPGTFRKRFCMLATDPPEGFFYQLLRGCDPLPSIKDIELLVVHEGIGLIIIDSLYRTGWLSEENNNDQTGRELTPIQALAGATGATVAVVDHTAKGGGEGRSAVDASRGASAKGGFFDGILVLRPTDQGPDPKGNYVILDPVLRDWPSVKELPLLSFTWSQSSCDIAVAGEVESNATNADPTVILSKLAECEKPVRVSHVAREAGLSEGRARRALAALVNKGKVIEAPDANHPQAKVYRLADIGDPS